MRKKKIAIKLPRSVHHLFPQVTSAVDANEPIEVSVNPKDCKEATKLDPTNCALARAAKRELHADGVIIGMSSSYIIRGTEAIRFATPESVRREIVSFDRHADFAPGDYHLPPKAPTARLGEYARPDREGSHGSNKAARRKIHRGSARVRMLRGAG
jgi:hypothetical protein